MKSGYLTYQDTTNQDTSLIRMPHLSGHLTNHNTPLIRTLLHSYNIVVPLCPTYMYISTSTVIDSTSCHLNMVWCGDGAERQAKPGSCLVGLARDGEGVGSVEGICEGTAGEEGPEQSGPRDAEREEVSMAASP